MIRGDWLACGPGNRRLKSVRGKIAEKGPQGPQRKALGHPELQQLLEDEVATQTLKSSFILSH